MKESFRPALTTTCPFPPSLCELSYQPGSGHFPITHHTLSGNFQDFCHFLNAPGPATRLTVAIKAPATSHEVSVSKIDAWLKSGGKSPSEQVVKTRLRELLGV